MARKHKHQSPRSLFLFFLGAALLVVVGLYVLAQNSPTANELTGNLWLPNTPTPSPVSSSNAQSYSGTLRPSQESAQMIGTHTLLVGTTTYRVKAANATVLTNLKKFENLPTDVTVLGSVTHSDLEGGYDLITATGVHPSPINGVFHGHLTATNNPDPDDGGFPHTFSLKTTDPGYTFHVIANGNGNGTAANLLTQNNQDVTITGTATYDMSSSVWTLAATDVMSANLPPAALAACHAPLDVAYVWEDAVTMNNTWIDGTRPPAGGLAQEFIKDAVSNYTSTDQLALIDSSTKATPSVGYTSDFASIVKKLTSDKFTKTTADLGAEVTTASSYMHANPHTGHNHVVIIFTDGMVKNVTQANAIATRDFNDPLNIRYYVVSIYSQNTALQTLGATAGGQFNQITGIATVKPTVTSVFTKINADSSCQINGFVINDLNGNGKRDANEPGLGGWTIELDQVDATGAFAGHRVVSSTVNPVGSFSFGNLVAGQYKVKETRQDGWDLSNPSVETSTITLPGAPGTIIFANHLTNPLGITATLDVNKNTVRDGETVQLHIHYTNPSGEDASNAVISQPLPANLTNPADNSHTITVTIGTVKAHASGDQTFPVVYHQTPTP